MNKNNNNNGISKNQKKKLRKAERSISQLNRQSQLKSASDNLPTGKIVTLSSSASTYARCLANPSTGPLATVPVHPAQLSKKFRVWVKGTFDVQTSNGIGWIAFSPIRAIANDRDCVFTSIGTGGSANWFDWNTANNIAAGFSNSEYTASQVGLGEQQFEFRTVSAELKIRYIGTELNRAGQKVLLMDPNHQSLYLRTLSSLDGEETSRRFPVDRSWSRVLYRPVDNDDFDFDSTAPPVSTLGAPLDFFMGVALQAPAGVSTPFEYEAFACFEVYGKNIRAMTPSHVDPTGFGAVHAISQLGSNLYPTKLPGTELEKVMVKDAAAYVKDQTTTYSHVGKSSKNDQKDALDATLGSAGAGTAIGLGLLGALSFLF